MSWPKYRLFEGTEKSGGIRFVVYRWLGPCGPSSFYYEKQWMEAAPAPWIEMDRPGIGLAQVSPEASRIYTMEDEQ